MMDFSYPGGYSIGILLLKVGNDGKINDGKINPTIQMSQLATPLPQQSRGCNLPAISVLWSNMMVALQGVEY